MIQNKVEMRAVVAPVFNEPDTWRDICLQLQHYFDCVVVVDDGSDEPLSYLQSDPFTVLRHTQNHGKGTALETGFRYCLAQGATTLASIDTDGEHDPRNFKEVLQRPLKADLVNFSRADFFENYGFYRRNRNQLISGFLSNKWDKDLLDSQSGMRLFSARAVKAFLREGLPAGYAVETAMLEILSKEGFSVTELPMAFEGEIRNGKKYSSLGAFVKDFMAFTTSLAKRKSQQAQAAEEHRESPLLAMRFEDNDIGLK